MGVSENEPKRQFDRAHDDRPVDWVPHFKATEMITLGACRVVDLDRKGTSQIHEVMVYLHTYKV